MELTPRTEDEARPPRSGRRRIIGVLGIVLVLAAAGLVMVQALGDASVFFRNADEAVEQRAELGDRRFRLQGTVVRDTIAETGLGVDFVVAYNGVEVPVHHIGDPAELFQAGVPVVLEGSWGDDAYESDWMAVKHTEVYEEDNGGRLRDAEDGGEPGAAGATSTTL